MRPWSAGARSMSAMRDVEVQTPDWLRPMEGILDELNEGVVIADDRHRAVFVNEALIRMSGYERGEIRAVRPMRFFQRQTFRSL